MKKPRKPRARPGGDVFVEDFPSFNAAVRYFVKQTKDIVREVRQRQYFTPKPTRSARARRGAALERRYATLPVVPEEEEYRRAGL